jgi:hypothetical protein
VSFGARLRRRSKQAPLLSGLAGLLFLTCRPDSRLLFTRRMHSMPDATQPPATLRSVLARISVVALITLGSVFVALYAGDYLVLRYRIAVHGPDAATAGVPTFYAAPLKNGRMSVYYDEPQMQTCVRSIFPWLGYEPCWYVKRHTINMS